MKTTNTVESDNRSDMLFLFLFWFFFFFYFNFWFILIFVLLFIFFFNFFCLVFVLLFIYFSLGKTCSEHAWLPSADAQQPRGPLQPSQWFPTSCDLRIPRG